MADDPVRDIVARHFRIYDEREEKLEGTLLAHMYFIMFEPAVFDAAYEKVRNELRAHDEELLVFLRRQGGEDILFVAPRPPAAARDVGIASTLLVLTFITTSIQGALFWHGFTRPGVDLDWPDAFNPANLWYGFLTFSLPLMAILLVHESAHYFTAKRHGLRASLPFFIPLPPIGFFGTLGAFIRMRDPLPDRKSLFDVGASGPIAGFVIAIPIIVIGAMMTANAAVALPDAHDPFVKAEGFVIESNENGEMVLIMNPAKAGVWQVAITSSHHEWEYQASVTVRTGEEIRQEQFTAQLDDGETTIHTVTVAEGADSVELTIRWNDGLVQFGDPLIVTALRPIIGEEGDHLTHPVFFAGWVGLFITGLNLLPLGQLDGGHVSRAVFGDWSRNVAMITMIALVIMSFWFQMWLFVALLVFFFMGTDHPPPLNDRTVLDGKRKAIAGMVLLVFALCFVPVPLVF